MKSYWAVKHRPKRHPTVIEIWSKHGGNKLLLIRMWAVDTLGAELLPTGHHEYKASEILCESDRFKVHQPAVVKKDETGGFIRRLAARVMLWDCFDKETEERFADQFGRYVLSGLPVSMWRFDEATLMAGILECRQKTNELMKILDVSK